MPKTLRQKKRESMMKKHSKGFGIKITKKKRKYELA